MSERDWLGHVIDNIDCADHNGLDDEHAISADITLGHLRALASDRDARAREVGELRAALSELMGAAEFSVQTSDDIKAMMRYGQAWDAARESLARLDGRPAEGDVRT